MNPAIFRTYDIRGTYGTDFDAQFAQRLGNRVAGFLQGKPMVIGRDARASSDELAYAVIDGAMHAGAHIIDLGIISSPQLYWAARALGAAGGIMVTASHNADKQNGFKVVANRGEMLDIVGGNHLRQIYDGREEQYHAGGAVEYRDIISDYAAAIAYAAKWQGGKELRCAVDGPEPVRRTLERLGPIAPDDGLAIRFDADGDRVLFYDAGQEISPDFIFLLLVEQFGFQPALFDMRFSRTVRTRLDAREVPYFISRSGRLYMVLAMRHTGAVLGAEVSGHYYWKEFGGMEAPELTMLRLHSIVQKSGRSLTELVAPYRTMVKRDDIKFPVRDDKHAVSIMHLLKERFHDGLQKYEDGLTVEYPDWWFTIRKSNTEPLMRFTIEAKTKDLLDRKVEEVQGLVSGDRK